MNPSIVVAGRFTAIALLAAVAFAASSRLAANHNAIAADPRPVTEAPKDRLELVSPQTARTFGRSPQGPTSHYGVRKLRAILTTEALAVEARALVEVNGTIPETLFWVVRILPENALQPGSHLDGIEPIAERYYKDSPASPGENFVDLIPIDTPLAPGTYAVQVALETIDGRRAAAMTIHCTID